jgi:hypothetical protein
MDSENGAKETAKEAGISTSRIWSISEIVGLLDGHAQRAA